MRSCFKIMLMLSLALGLVGCNLPAPSPAITPLAVRGSPTPVMPLDTPATEQPTPAPTASVPADWQTYMDQQYGFTFRYPKEGQIFSQENGYARINGLPFAPGTNLVEKYLEVNVAENANPCSSPLTQGYAPGHIQSQQVTINGLAWVIEGGEDAGAGQIHTWTAYSTVKGNACVSLSFILHSTNPGMYSTPPPLFDEAAESAVFADIVFTFVWLNP